MKLEDIKSLVASAKWFSALGNYEPTGRQLALSDLHAWDKSEFASNTDKQSARIASEMEWLPSSRDQEDPIHGRQLIDSVNSQALILDVYKQALLSLRDVNNSLLHSGPNDFTQAAIGAALFCVRMASIEVIAGQEGYWCELLELYKRGHWPCGLMPDHTLVVF